MKKKLMIVLPIVLLLAGGAFMKLHPLGAKTKKPIPKVKGVVFQLGTGFVVNLAGTHYGKISVGLVMKKKVLWYLSLLIGIFATVWMVWCMMHAPSG